MVKLWEYGTIGCTKSDLYCRFLVSMGSFWKKYRKWGGGWGGSSVSKGEPTLMEAAARMSL